MFVNREKHLEQLHEMVRDVQDGRGGALIVDGLSGMGKTSLLDEFSRRIPQFSGADGREVEVVRTRCLPGIGPGLHYGPVGDVLLGIAALRQPTKWRRRFRAAGQGVSGAAPELLSLLVPGLGPALSIGQKATAAALDSGSIPFDSLLPFGQGVATQLAEAILDQVRSGPPLIVLFDDVQYMDPSSLHVLDRLLLHLPHEPLGLVLSQAVGDAPAFDEAADSVEELLRHWEHAGLVRRSSLGGLPDAAVAELVRTRHPEAPTELPSRLSVLTAGHPIFVHLCLEEWHPQDGSRIVLPESVSRVVDSRMRRLGREDRTLLATAAVQGPEFLSGPLAEVVGRPHEEVMERLREIARARRLITGCALPGWAREEPSDCYRFQHQALWRVLYEEEQTPQQRTSRHARTAVALTPSDGRLMELGRKLEVSYHLDLGGPGCLASAARTHYELARSAAVEGLSFAEAERHCEKAIHAARALRADAPGRDRRLVECIELLLSLTEVRWRGEHPSAGGPRIDALALEAEEAAVRCAEPQLIARTTLLRGKTLMATQGLVPALGKLREAVHRAQELDDPVALFVAKVEYGRQASKRRLADGVDSLLQAEQLYAAEPRLGGSGDPVLQHARNLNEMQLGISFFDLGRLGGARERLLRCVNRLREEPLHAELPIALNYLAQVHLGTGQLQDAEKVLDEARRFEAERGGDSGWNAYNTALLAQTLVSSPGRWQEARTLIQEAWQETERTWLLNLVPLVRNLYAQVLLETSSGAPADLEEAYRLAGDTVAETRDTGMVRSEIAGLSLLGRIGLRQGALTQAVEHARQAVQLLDRTGDMPALRTEEVHYRAAQVLHAARMGQEADGLLGRARAEVARKAASLDDVDMRRAFLDGVPLNRAIVRGDLAGELS
ncbi:AAA family ATPase [Streptomyces sp. NPDC004111]|uniref:AAA family ATPase n=1 Tax=Streptomyces sp. NPDC004111 TaxID=3364690 RepID=UPI003692BDC6